MKFFAIFAFLGFLVAVSAIPSSSVPTSTSDVQSRESWDEESMQARDLVYFEERNYTLDEDIIARHLGFEELSERDYAELEERNPALVVRVAVQAIKLIVKAIRAGIDKDKKASVVSVQVLPATAKLYAYKM